MQHKSARFRLIYGMPIKRKIPETVEISELFLGAPAGIRTPAFGALTREKI